MCERLNCTLVEKANCLLFDQKLEKMFWAEAVNTAVYLKNRSTAVGLGNKTPYEVWSGKRQNANYLRIFSIKGYRVYDPTNNTVTTSRDIVIIENLNENKIYENIKNIDVDDETTIPVRDFSEDAVNSSKENFFIHYF